MKHSITLQRLCLFLLVFLLAAPAWSKSETWKARDRKKREVEGTRTSNDGIVTVTWSDCKTGPALTAANRNWVMKKGSSVTISCKDGWRVRAFHIREQLENPTYINCVDDNRYKKKYYEFSDETHEKSLNISCWDAPSQDIRIEALENVEFAVYEIDYVKAVSVGFKHSQYNVYSMSGWITPEIISNGHTGNVRYSLENNGTIAKVLEGGKLHIMRPGKGVFTVTYLANGTYAKSEGSTTINVMRDKVTFSKKNEVNLISCDNNYGIFELFDHNTSSHRDYNTDNGGISVTSSNPNVVNFDGRVKCGSKAGEATITIKQAKNDYYEATTFSQTFYVIRRNRDGAMLIKDAAEWKLFCKLVNEKGLTNLNARLDGDVNLGGDIVMVGTNANKYAGTFNGQEYALKINWNSGNETDIAPFKSVNGATIKNLRTEGTIKSSSRFLAGLIDEVYGDNNTISGCVSNVNITSTYADNRCAAGGLISYISSNTQVTITDCLVKGEINGTGAGRKGMGGFVYTNNGTCKLTNCLYAGTNNGSNEYSYTFAPDATLNNCYYLNTCGDAQGTQITKDQLRSGEVAHKLQAGRGEYTIWGQDLDSDAQPMPTNAPLKMVYEVKFSYKGQVRTTRYANRGKGIYGSLPTAKEILGSNFNPQDTYNFTFSGKFTTSTPITADRTVIVTILINNCYMIGSKEEWKEFCELVKDGQTNLDAKMTADINLGRDIAMVGNNEYSYAIVGSGRPYTGTFDGQGHTLNVSWYPKEGYKIAPFQSVNNATIKNLCVTGNINSEMDRGIFGGLISNADGNTTITNCITDMRLTIKDGDVGGMVCEILGGSLTMTKCVTNGVITLDNRGYGAGMIYSGYNASITMTDCLVKVFFRPSDWARLTMSGFIYSIDYKNEPTTKPVTLNNCLYLGAGNVTQLYGPLRTFAPEKYTTLNNCYHLNKCGETPQGTQVTEKQLKSGEITKLLQNNRTDVCHWAQVLGEMPNLYHAPDKSRTNYVYYDAANSRWTCEDFRITDGTPLPIGLDFLATKATYERPFSSKNNATVCLPYELPRNGSFTAYNLSAGSNTSISFKETKDKLEAYRPYYITANGTPQLDGTNLQVKAYNADGLKQPAGAFRFVGTVDGVDNATAAAANAYILQDDGKFHKVTTEYPEATVPAYRAYITCPKTLGAKQLSVVLDGETTGIGDVTNEANDGKNGPVYDLQGRRVADRLDAARHQLPAGVYIVNGRKVVVK